MAQIFISYSRADAQFISDLVPLLHEAYGVASVFYDEQIPGGTKWWEMILREIAACDLFVYLCSNDSLQSPYCQSELREAVRLQKQILPVIVRPKTNYPFAGVDYGTAIPDDVAAILRDTNCIDLSKGFRDRDAGPKASAKLYRGINEALKKAPAAPQQPLTPYPTMQPQFNDKKKRSWLNELRAIIIAALITGMFLMIGVVITLIINGQNVSQTQETLPLSNSPSPTTQEIAAATTLPSETSNPTPTPRPKPTIPQLAAISARNGNNEIYLVNADGTNLINLTNTSASEDEIDWSPDGQFLTFTSNRSGSEELYVMRADGGNVIQLTFDNAFVHQPQWSTDGTRIAFVSNRTGTNEVFVINADATGETQVTRNEHNESGITWSPDGIHIAYSDYGGNEHSAWEVFLVEVSTGREYQLTLEGRQAQGTDWASTGILSYTYSDRNYVVDFPLNSCGDIRLLPRIGTMGEWGSQWSPDGSILAVHSRYVGSGNVNWTTEINLIDPYSGDVTNVTSGREDWWPSISEDNMWVAYLNSADLGNTSDIYVKNISSGQAVQVLDNVNHWQAAKWRPSHRTSGPQADFGIQNPIGFINTQSANLRREANANSSVVGGARKGDCVNMLAASANSEWMQIQTRDGLIAWISSGLLSVVGETIDLPTR